MINNKLVAYGGLLLALTVGVGWYMYGEDIIERGDLLYTPNNPMAVANDFWLTALNENDVAGTRYLSKKSKSESLIPGYSKFDRAILSTSEQSNGVYFVKTTLMLFRENKHTQIPLYTVVVSEDGQFKVDLDSTLSSVEDAALENALAYYSSAAESAYTLFFNARISEEEKTRLLDTTLSNLEQRMCNVRDAVIAKILPRYADNSKSPSYCQPHPLQTVTR